MRVTIAAFGSQRLPHLKHQVAREHGESREELRSVSTYEVLARWLVFVPGLLTWHRPDIYVTPEPRQRNLIGMWMS